MRITNGMMNNNQLYNINNNKTYMDQLNNQMSTQKKINNPSDDPIVAVRSLRLRSSLSEITQYYSKNVPDAVSWVETTGTAIDTAKDLLSSMKSQYTSGANDTNTVEDRETILDELKALSDQLYATGNSANEDRYLFTGYRTGVSLTFTEEDMTDRTSEAADTDHPFVYKGITEIFDIDDVESYSFMKRVVTDADITNLSSSTTDETTVDHVYDEVYRLRLAYDNIDTSSEGGTFSANFSGGASITITEVTDDADIPATDGKLDNPMAIYLNTSTGNLVFGSVIRSMTASGDLTITYDKSEWQVGDLKPEHYFKCTEKGKKNTSIDYNSDPTGYNQKINFTVSEGQQITINTNANELFVHAVGRDVEELELAIEDVNAAQKKVDKLKAMQEDTVTYGESDQERIALLLNAANKELDYATQKMTKMFSNGVTKAQEYFDAANLAGTTTGTASSRLTIIKNRLSENKATVTTQASDNENVEISDVTVEVSAAQLAYNAALIATGKIAQQSLVNYI